MGYGAFTTPYKNAPEMDSGISVSNNAWATGTFGGYVELSDGRSAPKLCGLTCHHVLRPPPQPSVMTHEVFSPYDSATSSENITISHPSMGDHQESMRGDQRSAQKERYRLQELHERIDMLGNEAHPKLFQQVDRLKERITYHEERLQAAEVNREIGKVMFSSGYKVSGDYGCVLDWGLIELYPTRTGCNLLPDRSATVTYSIDAVELHGRAEKFGRTTGHTGGVINPVDSYVRFPGSQFALETREIVVLSETRTKVFSEGGDSGAWVLDSVGALMGMTWGGFTCRQGTFVTPIKAITDDIRSQTGHNVRLPDGYLI
ncbi:MAG: hypothetical protein FRX48_04416 [Lasallia pustulata]|uniref:Uncharacterized protein n=1 Tax=Lasallia pustulata TaxID=136370 RepID=A0A5M8PUF5_9LECA|nr:MAG: hypothetical protein FRX48_04416 [Lasallia pustulata]